MTDFTRTLPMPRHLSVLLIRYVLPLGWAVLLTSLFWVGRRSAFITLFYLTLALPTLCVLLLQPALLKRLAEHEMFKAFGLFALYMIVSQLWGTGADSFVDGLKRPLYIGLLLCALALLSLQEPARLATATRWAAVLAALCAGTSLVWFWRVEGPGDERMAGYGAFDNPLLTAHVLGAFSVFWLASWFQARRPWCAVSLLCLAVLVAAVLATGSRTPLMAIAAALGWLVVVGNRRRGLLVMVLLGLLFAGVLVADPGAVTQRGVSFRPAIWLESLRQISVAPWFGHGYGTDMIVQISGLDRVLYDPHNIELGVLYAGGIVGLLLWFALYATAARACWRLREDPAMVTAGAWLIYGVAAGLTEGSAFMSRPKEHWFLIWIPMAMVFGRSVALRLRGHQAP